MGPLSVIVLLIATLGTGHAVAEPAPCPDGYERVESVGGTLCVAQVFLSDYEGGGTHQDPRECEHGYYQGACLRGPAAGDSEDAASTDLGSRAECEHGYYQGACLRGPARDNAATHAAADHGHEPNGDDDVVAGLVMFFSATFT